MLCMKHVSIVEAQPEEEFIPLQVSYHPIPCMFAQDLN